VTPRHLGIVAVSAEGAALCYRTIASEGAALFGRHAHPETSLHTTPLAEYVQKIDLGRWEEVGEMLLRSGERLRRVGAELLLCPDNTVHQGLDLVRARSALPWLHIAEEVAAVAGARGFRHLLVLGTRALMEGPVYGGKLGAVGISHEIPDAADRARVNEVIFEELVYGHIEDASRREFGRIIEAGRARGCDAVVLGCTEIPLLIDDTHSSLPTLDSTRILARAALRAAAARA
jgi:aspartate racemase